MALNEWQKLGKMKILKIRSTTQSFWKGLQKSARKGNLRADLPQLMGRVGADLKTLLPEGFTESRNYFTRTGRGSYRLFSRQSQLKSKSLQKKRKRQSVMQTQSETVRMDNG